MTGAFLEAGLGPEDGEADESDDQDHARPHDEIAEWHREIEPPPDPVRHRHRRQAEDHPGNQRRDDAEPFRQGVTSSANRGSVGLLQLHLEDPRHVGGQCDLGGDSGRGLEKDVVAVDVDLGVDID